MVDVFVGEQRAVQLELHEEPVELVGGPPANFNHDVALAVEATAAPEADGGGGCGGFPAAGGLGAPFLISATVRWMCEAQKASKAPPRASTPSTRALKGGGRNGATGARTWTALLPMR